MVKDDSVVAPTGAATAKETTKHQRSRRLWRQLVFAYSCVILVGLLVLAYGYADGWFGDSLQHVSSSALASAWAGALGGIAISFKGVYDHRIDSTSTREADSAWSNDWLHWHFGRPVTGIIVGIFVFIAMKAVFPEGAPSSFTLATASFVLGTQDSAFFAFVRKIGSIVLSVGKD